MTPEQQRIAIAEADGWKRYDEIHFEGEPTWCWIKDGVSMGVPTEALPDYLNDLNACHEMRKALKDEGERENYVHHLSQLVPQRLNCGPIEENGADIMVHCEFDLVDATAAQHAEAFLKAKGLWKDNP